MASEDKMYSTSSMRLDGQNMGYTLLTTKAAFAVMQ